MKTLYLTNSSANIAVDTENNAVSTIDSEDRYSIRNIYYIEEPMHVVFNGVRNGEEIVEEVDAKKGDILLMFYQDKCNKHILTIIKSKQWATNINNRRKMEQAEKEEWAKKQADSLEKCEACDMCSPDF